MFNEVYITQEGDTILSIAESYGIRVIDLIQANNLEDVYYLNPGTELVIPSTTPRGFTYYTVEKGDNLYRIAEKYGLTMENLAEINGLELNEYIFPGQKLLVPKEGVLVYITKEGDTTRSIYNTLGYRPDEIEILNQNIYLLPEQLIAYQKR